MKKSILLLTGAALLLAGCAKVENETIVPEPTTKHVVLKATVNEADTRVSADAAGSFSWQAGDEIAVYTDKGSVAKFTAANGGATADFEGDLPSDAGFGSYAFYPYADNFAAPSPDDHIVFTLGGVHNFVQDATNMPMMGAITDEGVTFEAVGGVLKLIVYNVPQGANEFRFVSTGGKKIAGNFTVTNGAIVTEDAVGAVEDTQKFLFQRPESGNMVFYIPLPTGTIGAFKVGFYGEDKNTPVYEKTANANLTVGLNKLIVAPALNAAPAHNIVLWSEDFSQYSSGSVPSGNQGTGYDDAVISYASSGSSTKIYKEALAGGTAPEILIAGGGGSFSASGIPTAGATAATLTFRANGNRASLSSTTQGVTVGTISFANKEATCTITIDPGVESFNLVFSNTNSNVRVDDIVVQALVGTAPTVPVILAGKESATIAAGTHVASIDGVRITDPLDDQGIVATTDVDWLELTFEGNQGFEVGKKLKATAKSLWFGEEARVATVTLKATGATAKTVTFAQNPSVVKNPTLNAIKGDATFTISWAKVTGAASYVGYYSTTELTDPTTGTELTITSGDDGYSAVPSQTVTNGTKYYIYVKVATLDNAHSNYAIAEGWATTDVTPSASIDYSTTYTSNIQLKTNGTEVSSVKVKIDQTEYAALKAGTGSKAGKITNLTIPQGSTHLHIHAAGWNGESVTLKITTGNTTIATQALTSDTGIKGSSTTFTLEGNLEDYYFDIPLTGMTTDKTFVFEATGGGKRFVLWGVNAE